MENYLEIAIPTNKEQLRHLTAGIMTGIHCLFPPLANPSRDSISIKKLKKGEGVWALQKDLLSFEFNGLPGTHMIWLEDAKSDKLLVTVKSWLRGSRSAGLGLLFDEFKFTISKVRHAFLAIPEEQGLLSPIIRVIVLSPPPHLVFLHHHRKLQDAMAEYRTLLRKSVVPPTWCRELV